MSITVLIICLLFLFLVSVPIAWALAISALITLMVFADVPLTMIPQRMFTGTDSFTLMAIPFFLLAGELMEKVGISDKLIEFSRSLVGHIRGGLGNVTVGGSMMFSAVSGSGIATTAAMGKITIPAMIQRGYHPAFAVAAQSTSGAMGIVIPPSIIMILYAVTAGPGASVSDMFVGGIIPGALMGLALMTTGYVISRRKNYPTEARVAARKIPWRALKAVPALVMPLIIILGITLGIVTTTESAVLAVGYALLLGLVTRKLSMRKLVDALYNSASATAMIMLIVASANVFAWVVTSEGLPSMLARQMSGLAESPLLVLFIAAAILLVIGMFLDSAAALIIVIPVMMPLVTMSGVDPVHFGVVAVIALAIGLATPPVGLNLFVASAIAGIDILAALRYLAPFIIALIGVLVLLILFPNLVLWLPELLD
ncbi:TRAP transporter large permease [Nesterenkonia muleiensis]|uniref:TRAP transporter large permease n=1 Tax=Nesterenkonia muleiensis TaxID=2282648 RepID=UPI000E7274F8|nr:TRAP transporter large permease [Nesterenkonia muleiensis]